MTYCTPQYFDDIYDEESFDSNIGKKRKIIDDTEVINVEEDVEVINVEEEEEDDSKTFNGHADQFLADKAFLMENLKSLNIKNSLALIKMAKRLKVPTKSVHKLELCKRLATVLNIDTELINEETVKGWKLVHFLENENIMTDESNSLMEYIKSVDESIICPISHFIMIEPVVLSSGIVVSKQEMIEACLIKENRKCPVTRANLLRLAYECITSRAHIATLLESIAIDSNVQLNRVTNIAQELWPYTQNLGDDEQEILITNMINAALQVHDNGDEDYTIFHVIKGLRPTVWMTLCNVVSVLQEMDDMRVENISRTLMRIFNDIADCDNPVHHKLEWGMYKQSFYVLGKVLAYLTTTTHPNQWTFPDDILDRFKKVSVAATNNDVNVFLEVLASENIELLYLSRLELNSVESIKSTIMNFPKYKLPDNKSVSRRSLTHTEHAQHNGNNLYDNSGGWTHYVWEYYYMMIEFRATHKPTLSTSSLNEFIINELDELLNHFRSQPVMIWLQSISKTLKQQPRHLSSAEYSSMIFPEWERSVGMHCSRLFNDLLQDDTLEAIQHRYNSIFDKEKPSEIFSEKEGLSIPIWRSMLYISNIYIKRFDTHFADCGVRSFIRVIKRKIEELNPDEDHTIYKILHFLDKCYEPYKGTELIELAKLACLSNQEKEERGIEEGILEYID